MKHHGIAMSSILILGAAALVGCSADAGPAPTEPASTEEICLPTSPQNIGEWCDDGSPLEIALIQASSQHSFYNTMAVGARDAGTEFDVSIDVQGAADFAVEAQSPVISAVIQSEPDAILVATTSRTAIEPLLVEAAEAGIMVFTVDNDTENPELRWTGVKTDHAASVAALADTLSELFPEGGDVGVVASSGTGFVENIRLTSFADTLAADGSLAALAPQFCQGDTAKCASVTTAVVETAPNLKAIFASGEPMGVGVGNALRGTAHAGGNVVVAATDASPSQQRDLAEDTVQMLVVQRPYEIGYETVRIVSQLLRGEPADSPLLDGPTVLEDLPAEIVTGFDLAVSDLKYCADDVKVNCGTTDDEDIKKYLYVG